ncbi:mitogen-activated protein kinase kinase kinase 1-like [Prunus yedoensis var. nudiflora]|uniref:Mitogen-activated protein kinase kinase kinase 1-like n=1 Tax=Prunus yedoensis var. nudiflora TaxID=2094558 RepID=A0A314YCG4_PRUYE|nr:mitogen-activated protein kinase kinase kinase 1-like [Prunus yedoensis var. nudiflora]
MSFLSCSCGCFIAVKEVSLLDKGSQGVQRVYQLEQEIALLSQFEHQNIVQYYGTAKILAIYSESLDTSYLCWFDTW